MGLELRIRTTGWSRELIEHAKTALRELDWNEDHYVYEVVISEDGDAINLEELEILYDQILVGPAVIDLDLQSRGYQLLDFDDLETDQLLDFRATAQLHREAPDEPPVTSAEDFIRDFGQYLEKIPP